MLKSASVQSQLDHLFVEAIKVAHTLLSADRGTLWLWMIVQMNYGHG